MLKYIPNIYNRLEKDANFKPSIFKQTHFPFIEHFKFYLLV